MHSAGSCSPRGAGRIGRIRGVWALAPPAAGGSPGNSKPSRIQQVPSLLQPISLGSRNQAAEAGHLPVGTPSRVAGHTQGSGAQGLVPPTRDHTLGQQATVLCARPHAGPAHKHPCSTRPSSRETIRKSSRRHSLPTPRVNQPPILPHGQAAPCSCWNFTSRPSPAFSLGPSHQIRKMSRVLPKHSMSVPLATSPWPRWLPTVPYTLPLRPGYKLLLLLLQPLPIPPGLA